MTLAATDVWANGITPTATLDAKTAADFACGDADPDLFNHVLKLYGECIVQLQTDVGLKADTSYVDAGDAAVTAAFAAADIVIANAAQAANDALQAAYEAADANLQSQIDTLSGAALPEATVGNAFANKGIINVAPNGQINARTATEQAVSPLGLHQYEQTFGSLGRLYGESTDVLAPGWNVLVGGASSNSETYNASDVHDLKGSIAVRFSFGGTFYSTNFNVFWDNTNDPEVFLDYVHLTNEGIVVKCEAVIATTLLTISLRDAAGALLVGGAIQNIKRLGMAGVFTP